MDTRSRVKGNNSPVVFSDYGSGDESDIDFGNPRKSNGVVNKLQNGDGKCRLSLIGTAVLQRENEPILSATYNYWTDQAGNFFHESLQDIRRIQLSKVSFGVNAYKERCSNQKLSDGIIVKNTGSAKATGQSDYMWSQVPLVPAVETSCQKWFRICNTFAMGFASCVILILFIVFFLLKQ